MVRNQRNSSMRMRLVALPLPPIVRYSFLLVLCFIIFSFLTNWSMFGTTRKTNASSSGIGKRLSVGQSKERIAIVIPFVGEDPGAIPPYLELFCSTAAGSATLVDFLLIHNGVLDHFHADVCPPNVIFISLHSTSEFSTYLVRVADRTDDNNLAVGSRDKLARILSNYIIQYPYVLVEFKPALGHIFSDFLAGYSHWGYSDLDIIFGDLPRWITRDELQDFDIVTYGFGDQTRLYLRGQFTFHANTDKVNQLWRSCDYLSHMDQRFANVMTGHKHLHFESAEGCYSAAVLAQTDVRVKYAVKAFTDIDEKDTAYSHGLYVATGKRMNATVLYKAGSKADGPALSKIPDTWFEVKDAAYNKASSPLQWETGTRTPLSSMENSNAKCMFWAQQKYQSRLCIEDVDETYTVFWINGQLYKQKYQTVKVPGKLATAPFFHFQEWKRFYRVNQLTGFHRYGPVRTFVLSKEGVLPLYHDEYKHEKSFVPSPLGIKPYKWNGLKNGSRQQLPRRSYCLRSGPREVPSNPLAPKCKVVTSWRDQKMVEITSAAPAWTQLDASVEVTLALTLQIQAEQATDPVALGSLLELVATYLNRWQGQPSVLVVHVAGATPDVMTQLRIKLGLGTNLSYNDGLDTCLVGIIFSESHEIVSRKALMNMAIDAAPTRWVMNGFELERGIVISQDAAFFAHRVARTQEDMPGSVFLVPQFGLSIAESDFSLSSLWKAKESGDIQALSTLEEGVCEGGEDSEAGDDGSFIFDPVLEFWWQQSELFMKKRDHPPDERELERNAIIVEDIQDSLVSLLTEDRHYSLFAMDISPILLVDNLGPRAGMITSDIAREVEEFAGKQCYNGLRLAQLATYGYSIDILAGAFAMSTATTRSYASVPAATGGKTTTTTTTTTAKSALGASRCDGCFMFLDEYEDILEDIATDERKRPAKAALLWMNMKESEPLYGHT